METLTPTSSRAARGILKWSIRDLAKRAGVSPATVHLIEAGEREPQALTVGKLIAAFTSAGVELLPPPADGARRRADEG